tara:strand:+ start:251 stop:1069 length:819 start_codon:yes stop_codon:yes gene_type:complete
MIFTFLGCSGNQNDMPQTSENNTIQTTAAAVSNEPANNSTQISQQMSYEIKKLNADINYLKEQIQALDLKSSLYADPFAIYNKEIMLNNGSSIFCKILSQDNEYIFVETLIGNLTIDRNSVVRIVENITVLEEGQEENQIIEISQEESAKILDDSELISQRQASSSASVILLGDIRESSDKSGNTIFEGDLKNVGTQRADLVRIDFILRKNFQGDTEMLTAYAKGSSQVFQDGIISNSSLKPDAIGTFKLIVPNSLGNFIGYSYEIYWSYYE